MVNLGYERATKKAVMESSARKILLADSSKFGEVRTEYFADLASFNVVVTDFRLPEEHRTMLRRLGIDLVLA